jgi:hypothetical protein
MHCANEMRTAVVTEGIHLCVVSDVPRVKSATRTVELQRDTSR